MDLKRGLVSYWKLDEAAGDALDAHGTNHLSDTNTVGGETGRIRSGRDFEEDNNEYFERLSNRDLQTGDIDFTITAWVKPETSWSGADAWVVVAKDDDGAGTGREYLLVYNGFVSQWVGSVFKSGASEASATESMSPSAGAWYFLAFWHDATARTVNLQINNGSVNSTPTGGALQAAGSTAFRVGARAAGTAFPLDGVIDEVGFWKRTLSHYERMRLFNGGLGLPFEQFTDPTPVYKRVFFDVAAAVAEGAKIIFKNRDYV